MNLAAASTVVTIRKALSEWAPNAVVTLGPDRGASIMAPPPSRRHDSFKQMPIVEPSLFALTPLVPMISGKVLPPLASMKRLVERLSDGATNRPVVTACASSLPPF